MAAGTSINESEQMRTGRKRVERIFRFLEAKSQRENKAIRRIEDQQWTLWFHEIPDHRSIVLASHESEAKKNGVILKVNADDETPCPTPHAILRDWLQRGWEDLYGDVMVWPSRNQRRFDGETEVILFEDDAARPRQFNLWLEERNRWKPEEIRKRKAMALYEELHRQWGELNREGEKVEFVLGDGILSFAHENGDIYHPILFQRLELEFDPSKREFRFIESTTTPELYNTLLYELIETEPSALGNAVRDLENGEFHPLGQEEMSGFLQTLGASIFLRPPAWTQDDIPPRSSPTPAIGRKLGKSPVIFRRKRNLGFSNALKHVVQAIATGAPVPAHLLRIAGMDAEERIPGPTTERTWFEYVQPREILLSKHANREQVRIAENLDRTGAVLVQGPPGTGKTHTIANLIGHLLAQGKRILVTSYSTKALRVLREKVEVPLQPLCVSVLDSDAKSREELKQSVQHLLSKLTEDPVRLRKEAERLKLKRAALIKDYYKSADRLTAERRKEYDAIVIAGKSFQPMEAARIVAAGLGSVDYIPSPLELGASIPLTDDEISDLYESNEIISAEDEEILAVELPQLQELPGDEYFKQFVEHVHDLNVPTNILEEGNPKDYFLPDDPLNIQESIRVLEGLASDIAACIEAIASAPLWQLEIIESSLENDNPDDIWSDLVELIETTCEVGIRARRVIMENAPQIPADIDFVETKVVAEEIINYIGAGDRISAWSLTFRPRWKRLVQSTRVLDGAPTSLKHFQAIYADADLQIRRTNLRSRWERQVRGDGAPALDQPGRYPEEVLRQYAESLRLSSSWNVMRWEPLKNRILHAGIDWTSLYHDFAAVRDPSRKIDLLIESLKGPLQAAIARQIARLQRKDILITTATWTSSIHLEEGKSHSYLSERLLLAITSLDVNLYHESYSEIQRLQSLRQTCSRRFELLEKLKNSGGQGWARAVQSREGVHGVGVVPTRIADAWQWRQLSDTLNERLNSSDRQILEDIAKTTKLIQDTTKDLIVNQTWASQIDRCTPSMRRSLAGWLETFKGAQGLGARSLRLKREESKLLNECRDAVPVWIMPLTRVVESFDPRNAPFDVVIIDEASQMDLSGLLALYLAKEVVVVGDNEQVSPLAVGDNMDAVARLIETHLVDVPMAHLYDGRLSIYALAEQSFGCTIRLVEHFRCAPEIISFSNHLCYNGDIQPLRDTSSIQLKPHTVEHRVQNGISRDKVNIVEAEEVVSLILATCEQEEYQNKTIGVVSLVGDEQARQIEVLLRRHMPSEAFEVRHRVLCGNAAQFQGDERDVMFLSVVDSCDNPPLALRTQDLFKQRFNVAASRAKDQMWVVHSLSPGVDLKSGDLRKRLIDHASNPNQMSNQIGRVIVQAESVFESEVAQRLIQAGYYVIPQWKVGHYRIDLVVQGSKKRLAVECDGDQYHPQEKLEDDLARQAVLERLGWSFVRIRGSHFFRDRDAALEPLFQRLNEFGIEKLGSDHRNGQELATETELLIRVKRRAEELRREWSKISDPWDTAPLPKPEIVAPSPAKGSKKIEEDRNPDEISLPTKSQKNEEVTNKATIRVQNGVSKPTNKVAEASTPPPPNLREVKSKTVNKVSSEDWFAIAKWAKENDHLQSWQRGLAFTLGRYVSDNRTPSKKQLIQGERILNEVALLGFKFSNEDAGPADSRLLDPTDARHPSDRAQKMIEVDLNPVEDSQPAEVRKPENESNKELVRVPSGGSKPTIELTEDPPAAPSPEQRELKNTPANEVSSKDWFAIAKWARENDHLEGWQRKIAFTLGSYASKGWPHSEKQLKQGDIILGEVRRLGFNLSNEIAEVADQEDAVSLPDSLRPYEGCSVELTLSIFVRACKQPGSNTLFITDKWVNPLLERLRNCLSEPITSGQAIALCDAIEKRVALEHVVEWVTESRQSWAAFLKMKRKMDEEAAALRKNEEEAELQKEIERGKQLQMQNVGTFSGRMITGIPVCAPPDEVLAYPDFLTWWREVGRLHPEDSQGWYMISGPGMWDRAEMIHPKDWEDLSDNERTLIKKWAQNIPIGMIFD